MKVEWLVLATVFYKIAQKDLPEMSFSSDWLKRQKQALHDNGETERNPESFLDRLKTRVSFIGTGVGLVDSGSAVTLSTDGNAAATASSSNEAAMNYGDRFKGFVALLLSSGCFCLTALTFLPTVIIFPGKFALSFTCASVLFMGGFAVLLGPKNFMVSICSKKRVNFSAFYFGSMLTTLYSVFVARSYLLIFISASAQVVSLLWYASSYIPGGKYGMQIFSQMFMKVTHTVAGPCFQMWGACCTVCMKATAGTGGGPSSLLPR